MMHTRLHRADPGIFKREGGGHVCVKKKKRQRECNFDVHPSEYAGIETGNGKPFKSRRVGTGMLTDL